MALPASYSLSYSVSFPVIKRPGHEAAGRSYEEEEMYLHSHKRLHAVNWDNFSLLLFTNRYTRYSPWDDPWK